MQASTRAAAASSPTPAAAPPAVVVGPTTACQRVRWERQAMLETRWGGALPATARRAASMAAGSWSTWPSPTRSRAARLAPRLSRLSPCSSAMRRTHVRPARTCGGWLQAGLLHTPWGPGRGRAARAGSCRGRDGDQPAPCWLTHRRKSHPRARRGGDAGEAFTRAPDERREGWA